jgi:hypothetical protein
MEKVNRESLLKLADFPKKTSYCHQRKSAALDNWYQNLAILKFASYHL